MGYTYLHDVEQIELRSQVARPIAELSKIFRRLGFTFHDDVVCLERRDRLLPWQHSSIVEIEVLRSGEEVFGFDNGEWDTIYLRYLFASLPYELTETFVRTAISVAKELSLPLIRSGVIVDEASLRQRFAEIRKELRDQTGEEAGSERLAFLIHSTYPRG